MLSQNRIVKLFLIALLFLVGVFLYTSLNTNKDPELNDVLGVQYSNEYQSKTSEIGNLVVTVANSTDIPLGDGGHGEYNPIETPLIIVQDKADKKIRSQY
jgi:hypothetical protein